MLDLNDTIAAVATAPGGALSVIRVSGEDSLAIVNSVFRNPSGKKITDQKGYTILYGFIEDFDGNFVDEVLVSVFRSPHSYTGQNMAEISAHGSSYTTAEILRLLLARGARSASAGEFTSRAFIAGKMDLSQAEAVADLISSENRAAQTLAANQMRGAYSSELAHLRSELLTLASLVELELDFSEEDVTFADREVLSDTITKLLIRINSLTRTFALGNAIKKGVNVVIAGRPNVGKSTLLNSLVAEERAIVSPFEGTTRDLIEQTVVIDGVEFRFTDTAGIRDSEDIIERMGIDRTYGAMQKADILIYLVDGQDCEKEANFDSTLIGFTDLDSAQIILVINKADKVVNLPVLLDNMRTKTDFPVVAISAKHKTNISELTETLTEITGAAKIYGGTAILSNSRHYEALINTSESLRQALEGIENGLSGELLAQDINQALHYLGIVTGDVSSEEILGQIFSKFCIGK